MYFYFLNKYIIITIAIKIKDPKNKVSNQAALNKATPI
jgi:hypothetical protein